jgi:glycosyltransferase involved in cell wall biosynthesis
MRVLMLSKACIVGIYQRKLEEIARLGVELLTLVPPSWKDERGETVLERAYTDGYRLEVTPIARNGDFHLHFYPGLGRRIREFQPDIVHIDEEPYNLAAWQALYHARRAGAKSLFFSWQNLNRAYPPPFSWGERWLLRNINYALMGTESAAEVWRAKGYTGPLRVVPQFGVDPELFKPITPHPPTPSPSNGEGELNGFSKSVSDDLNLKPLSPAVGEGLGVRGKNFTIGFVGRLVPEKGVDLLLRAFAQLVSEGAGARLLLVGSGPERERLDALAVELGVRDCVEFIAWVNSMEMPALYPRMDALVLPSLTRPNWKEQFGRALTEAMACGVPVVGSDSGAIPNIIGDAGLIVPEGEVDALAGALRRLRESAALRAELGAKGRTRVLAHFTHQQVAADTVDVYREMMGQ